MRGAPLQLGIVGLGFGASVHLPAFRADPRCQVLALCGTQADKTRKRADELGVPEAFWDWKKMIADPRIQAVAIAVPPAAQVEVARAALECGKHVFCEKPLAPSLSEGARLLELARASGKAHLVDFELPEIPAWQTLERILRSGEIGKLRHISLHWNIENYAVKMGLEDSWKMDATAGGGALNMFASHSFHYLEWLFGPISALSARLFRAPGLKGDVDTVASLCLELASGVPIFVTVSCQSFLGAGHVLEVFGDQGTLVLSNPTADYVTGFELKRGLRSTGKFESVVVPDWTGVTSEFKRDGRIAAVQKLAEKFVSWAAEGKAAAPSFEQGYRVQVLMDAARRSSEAGVRVKV